MTDPADVTASRTSAVLDPSFVEGLGELSTEEVRHRRDQALAEREFASYLRRLVQVRQDLLVSERKRRAAGQEQQPLVERLASVLTEGPRAGPGRGEALRTVLSTRDVEEAERRADAIFDEAGLSDPERLGDDQLERSLAVLREGERAVSADRSAVIRVHDRLQEELKRRYREDPSQIPHEV